MLSQIGEPIWLDGNPYETAFSAELAVRAETMDEDAARAQLRPWGYSDEEVDDLLSKGL